MTTPGSSITLIFQCLTNDVPDAALLELWFTKNSKRSLQSDPEYVQLLEKLESFALNKPPAPSPTTPKATNEKNPSQKP